MTAENHSITDLLSELEAAAGEEHPQTDGGGRPASHARGQKGGKGLIPPARDPGLTPLLALGRMHATPVNLHRKEYPLGYGQDLG